MSEEISREEIAALLARDVVPGIDGRSERRTDKMRKETLQELSAMVKEIWRAVVSIESALLVMMDDLEDEALEAIEEVKE